MNRTQLDRSALALSALEYVPPLMRNDLLDDPDFRQDFGLATEALINFNDSGVSIQRSAIFDAVRQVLAGESEVDVEDKSARAWKLRDKAHKGQLPKLVIFFADQKVELPDFSVLSPKAEIRLHSLDRATSDVNLPPSTEESWREILANRALSDEEVEPFHRDIRDTPIHLIKSILSDTRYGNSTPSMLVPNSRIYFERLIGAYDGSATIIDYAAGAGKQFFQQLSIWKPYEGFLLSLLLSAHFSFSTVINVDKLGKRDLDRAFEYVKKHGDMLSKLGAIEIGLRILPEYPDLESVLIHLVEQIRDDDVNDPNSGFKLLEALTILADGELARVRLLFTEPPFYRRLASFTQAALIFRQLVIVGIAINEFYDWAINTCVEQYYMQSLVDMRLEPRWNPSLVSAFQLKAEFLGRMSDAANRYSEHINGSRLYSQLLGTDADSICSLIEFRTSFLPGPLEGTEVSPRNLPSNLADAINEQLSSGEVTPSSFIALVNSAATFGIDSDKVELATNALRLANHTLSNIQHMSELIATLNNLATVAANTRNRALADELRITCRKYRHDPKYRLSVREELVVCVVAAASRSEINDWREFIGEWLTELAMTELTQDEAKEFRSHLLCLVHAQPELWVSCGRAEAALTSCISH